MHIYSQGPRSSHRAARYALFGRANGAFSSRTAGGFSILTTAGRSAPKTWAGVLRPYAAAIDADMGRCILSLYRSGAQPAMAKWGRDLPAAARRPGLVIVPTEDPYTGGEAMALRAAARAGARSIVLQGRGHWWMCEDPALGARVLDDFFASLA